MKLSSLESLRNDGSRPINIADLVAPEPEAVSAVFDPRTIIDAKTWQLLKEVMIGPFVNYTAMLEASSAIGLLFPDRVAEFDNDFERGIEQYEDRLKHGQYNKLLADSQGLPRFLRHMRTLSPGNVDVVATRYASFIDAARDFIASNPMIPEMHILPLVEELIMAFPNEQLAIRADIPSEAIAQLIKEFETDLLYLDSDMADIRVRSIFAKTTMYRLFIPELYPKMVFTPQQWQLMTDHIRVAAGTHLFEFGQMLGQVAVAAATQVEVTRDKGLRLQFGETTTQSATSDSSKPPARREF